MIWHMYTIVKMTHKLCYYASVHIEIESLLNSEPLLTDSISSSADPKRKCQLLSITVPQTLQEHQSMHRKMGRATSSAASHRISMD